MGGWAAMEVVVSGVFLLVAVVVVFVASRVPVVPGARVPFVVVAAAAVAAAAAAAVVVVAYFFQR